MAASVVAMGSQQPDVVGVPSVKVIKRRAARPVCDRATERITGSDNPPDRQNTAHALVTVFNDIIPTIRLQFGLGGAIR
jgi:hypothetical protein